MNRMKLNYSIDVILTILFLLVSITGFLMYLVIPSGVPKGRYQEYAGITKATWTLIHNRSAILMIIFTGIHLDTTSKMDILCNKEHIQKRRT